MLLLILCKLWINATHSNDSYYYVSELIFRATELFNSDTVPKARTFQIY